MGSSTSNTLYLSSPILAQAALSTANPNRDGTGTVIQLFGVVSTSPGARIDWIRFSAIGSTSAGMVRVFLKNSSGVFTLLKEIEVAAVTPSPTVPGWSDDWFPGSPVMSQASLLSIGTLCSLQIATENADNFHVTAFGGYF